MFLNLSNHPSSKWLDGQLRATNRSCEDIIDVKFPNVPPEMQCTKRLAVETVKNIPNLKNVEMAMVQGEPSVAAHLVSILQKMGIPCYMATTKREVFQDGDKKTSIFSFIQFREWPKINID